MHVFDRIKDFYVRIIGLPIPETPTRLSRERKAAAVEHWREETQEFLDAETLEEEIDAALDLAWLAIGRVIEMGADPLEHLLEIAYANGTRVRGQSPKRPLSGGYDAVKPEGWKGPDHAAILAGCAASRREPKKRILILGNARHGKDTVAELLRDRHGYRFNSSSMFCAERVMMPYFAQHGVPYDTVEECYADRVNHRSTWYDKIEAYNRDDPSRLAREMLGAGNDMYVGMRSAMEFAEARKLFDLILWVDASGRGMPPEGRDSFDIDFEPNEMVKVYNNRGLDDLERTVDGLAAAGII